MLIALIAWYKQRHKNINGAIVDGVKIDGFTVGDDNGQGILYAFKATVLEWQPLSLCQCCQAFHEPEGNPVWLAH